MAKARRWLAGLLLAPGLLVRGDKYDPTTLVYPAFLHTLGIRKATKTHLMIYTRNRVKVDDPQGIAVVRLRSWEDPDTPEDDAEVTGYGVNSGANLIVYNTSMTSLGIYGLNEKGVRALNHPKGIAANERGDVYLADTGNDRIVRFYNPRKALQFVRAIGGTGSLPGQFLRPHDVALDSRGMVYVADTNNHRIQVLRPDDRLHLWFGKQGVEPGRLWHPSAVAVTDPDQRWSYFRDGFLVVVDRDHTRLQKFTLDGRFLQATTLQDFGYQSGRLAYLAIDYYNNVWVTDTQNHQIHKFDRNLNYLTSFGRRGTGDKEFEEPRGIAIRRRFGQVFVAERTSAQYYWVGTDVFDYRVEWREAARRIRIAFFLTEPSYVTLKVEGGEPKLATEVFARRFFLSGAHTVWVDAHWQELSAESEGAAGTERPANGARPRGRYTLTLTAEPTYSSYQHFSKSVTRTLEIL